MKADRSRDTFEPGKHYRRVLHQQGRVVMDADDNEQVSIDLATSECTISDVIGQAGVPEISLSPGYTGGFAIGIGSAGNSSSSSSLGSSSSSSSSSSPNSGNSPSSSSSSSSSSMLAGNDLTIAHGRIYVDGILVVNDFDTTLFTQPFLPLLSGDMSAIGLAGAGVYAVYLDVWERVVTPIDDPKIQEIALGGPDTCLRSQIAWQVRLGALDVGKFGENPACVQVPPPWPRNLNQGLLTAGVGISSAPLPCSLPPESGYRSLENQLYRVEIQTAGGYGTTTIKWSRENGAVLFGIVPAPGQSSSGTVSGTTLYVTSTGRDASLGVAHGDWVELIDDHSEYLYGHGELLQVDSSDADKLTITLLGAPSQPIELSRHPKLRRWDQSQNAGANGITVRDGTPIALENGVQVQFSDGEYAVGDYWLIPARTATTQQNVGTIEWPTDASGNYLPERPRGIFHHYCKLGIVAFDGFNFQAPQGSSAVTDCRVFFPPLTAVETDQCPCTITLQPKTNWTALLTSLFANSPALDAEICFAVGEFDTAQPVLIQTTGNVKVSGAGWGTRLIGLGLETVLRFKGCASVCVSDLSAVSNRVDAPVDAGSVHIGGALEFLDCAQVNIDGVDLTCGSSVSSGAACLTVRNTVTAANVAAGAGSVRVRDSRFAVGQMQYGMLLVHVKYVFVEGNELLGSPDKPPSFTVLLTNASYRKLAERALIGGAMLPSQIPATSSSSATSSSTAKTCARIAARKKTAAVSHSEALTPAPAAAAPKAAVGARAEALPPTPIGIARLPNTGVKVGATSIAFNTPQQLKGVWQTYVDSNAPKEFASSTDLLKYVKSAASNLLTNVAAQRQFAGFSDIVRFFERNQIPVARAGIVVGGQALTELHVSSNSIDGFMQGVVVGVSHREVVPPKVPADTAGAVFIRDNRINVAVDPVLGHAAGRYAIYVGNADSLLVEGNRATLTQASVVSLANEGIHAFGYIGRRLIVRHNHLTGFATSIHVSQVTAPGSYNTVARPDPGVYLQELGPAPLWLVADNIVEKSGKTPIIAPSCLQIDNTQA